MSLEEFVRRGQEAQAAVDRLTKCSQTGCTEKPAFRYTWPGKDESVICHQHSVKLRNVAEALGFHLQLIEIADQVLKGVGV